MTEIGNVLYSEPDVGKVVAFYSSALGLRLASCGEVVESGGDAWEVGGGGVH